MKWKCIDLDQNTSFVTDFFVKEELLQNNQATRLCGALLWSLNKRYIYKKEYIYSVKYQKEDCMNKGD